MQETYIGIDIAKDKFDVAILKNDSLILNFNNIIYKQFSNNENGFKKFTSYLKENGKDIHIEVDNMANLYSIWLHLLQ